MSDDRKCRPGELENPDGWCTWHRPHVYCATCRGWYGVPHDGIHEGPFAHPYQMWEAENCWCRVCMVHTGREVTP